MSNVLGEGRVRPVTENLQGSTLPVVGDDVLKHLIAEMNTAGYGMIANYLPPETLREMRSFVAAEMTRRGLGYLGFVGRKAVEGSVFAQIGEDAAFEALLRRIYELGTRRPAPPTDLYQVLRCLAGESGKGHSLIFHYDSYVVTALLPVEIPNARAAGDLVMLPNRRRIRRFYVSSLLDKVLLDNPLTQWLLRLMHRTGLLPTKRVKMIPGNAYFFWGYRSIHANEACDPSHTRATALYHFGNPHGTSQLGKQLRRLIPR
nr:hypothetical protein [uncultured Lichenicoccus sp.]